MLDWHTDELLRLDPEPVHPNAILTVDGCFLLVDRLRDYFELSVFLDVPAEERLRRAIPRQLPHFTSGDDLTERFRTRYLPGYALYLERDHPIDHADVVIDNSDFDDPVILKVPN